MERRSFLRGVFGGLTSGGLILAAKPKELEAFAAPLVPEQPLIIDPYQPQANIGEYLYNELGERVAVIQSIDGSSQLIDVTTFGDTSEQFMLSGFSDITITAIAVGGVSFEPVDRVGRNRWTPPYRLRGSVPRQNPKRLRSRD